METVDWLSDFYEAISGDQRIGCSHISLYITLIHKAFQLGWHQPISFYRNEILSHARISRRTYNKCMADLQAFGYLRYEPSTDSKTGSKVYLKRL